MINHGIKVSGPEDNVLSVDSKKLIASSIYPVPQIKMGQDPPHFGYGEATMPSTDTARFFVATIPHGYPYTPASLTLVSPERHGGDTWQTAPVVWFFGENTIDAWCDSENYYIKVNDVNSSIYGNKLKYRYYIFAQNGT